MGRRQERVYHVEPEEFPQDFPERLDRFRQAAGLSWRELARRLKVNARIVRRWKAGTKPGPATWSTCWSWPRGWGCSTTCCAEWKSRARSRGRANDQIQAGTHGEGMPGLRSGLLPAVPARNSGREGWCGGRCYMGPTGEAWERPPTGNRRARRGPDGSSRPALLFVAKTLWKGERQ